MTEKVVPHSLQALYAPIEEDLALLELRLQAASQHDHPWLVPILESLFYHRGKRLRPALALLAGRLFQFDPPRHLAIATGLELLHTATLIHDDVVDGSPLRRGHPTTLAQWRAGPAVLAGDYLFAAAGSAILDAGQQEVMELFVHTVMDICNGELGQVLTAYRWEITREQYYQQIAAKTAALFTIAAQSGAILGGAPKRSIEALRQYGHHLGIAFQMVDDILDFVGAPEELGKPVGSDLSQGTVTFPALWLIEQDPGGNPVHRFFQTRAPEDLDQAVRAVQSSPAIAAAYAEARASGERALAALEGLPQGAALRSLAGLVGYVLERRY